MNCKNCGSTLKLIPAGFSKTKKNPDGSPKEYDSFYVCPNKCKQEKVHPAANYFPKDNPNYRPDYNPPAPIQPSPKDTVLLERLDTIVEMITELDERLTNTTQGIDRQSNERDAHLLRVLSEIRDRLLTTAEKKAETKVRQQFDKAFNEDAYESQ